MTPKEVLAQIRQSEVTTVDLRFMDFPGVWQHFAIPADALTEETFEEGISFDGSSVVGWRAINEADLLVVPQPGEGKGTEMNATKLSESCCLAKIYAESPST